MQGLMCYGRLGVAIITLLLLCSCGSYQKFSSHGNVIYPVEYGILQAKSGIARYNILFKCHKVAVEKGYNVSYRGIDELEIEIPNGANPIPLTSQTDFVGVKIKVVNKSHNMYLYKLTQALQTIPVDAKEIDCGNFKTNSKLNNNKILLIVKDRTPWVNNRKGYSYGATRKDVMIINSGVSKTRPVQPYYNVTSKPECQFCPISGTPIVFKNIIFERSTNSTKITYLVNIENQANVTLSEVEIKTPKEHDMFGDAAITITNVANLTMQDIDISGTYSQKNKYGYGVYLNNILNLHIENMRGFADWGVFGNNNINSATLSNCYINRFDIHCYGRDVSFYNCKFERLYNQFSSIYGKVMFKKCSFTKFTPVLIESSYNAYTPFDIVWKDCVFNFDKKHCSVVDFSGFSKEVNSRPELRTKCLPNVTMNNCKVNLNDGLNTWYVFNTKKTNGYEGGFSHISEVVVEGLSTNDKSSKMEVYSHKVKTMNKVEMRIRNK